MIARPESAAKIRRSAIAARRRGVAAELCSSAIAVAVLMVILAALFRVATGQSPWPVFLIVEIPSATAAFTLLAATAPHRS